MNLNFNPDTEKRCPACGKIVPIDELYCLCGFPFNSNSCTNCGAHCGEYTAYCPDCGAPTQNYINGLF